MVGKLCTTNEAGSYVGGTSVPGRVTQAIMVSVEESTKRLKRQARGKVSAKYCLQCWVGPRWTEGLEDAADAYIQAIVRGDAMWWII